jgi:tRNA modification GTPase
VSRKTDKAPGNFQLLTSAGPAAIAVVRVTGPGAATFARRHLRFSKPDCELPLQPGQLRRAELLDAGGEMIDDVLVSTHADPPGWDLRVHMHANPALVRLFTQILGGCGLAPAQEGGPALWKPADALEAEAWTRLPGMLTLCGATWLLRQVALLRSALRALLDSGNTDDAQRICCRIADRSHIVGWFAAPARVVLAGPPNVGKSTLANALADRPVSVVSAMPGTTRDWVEVPGDAGGFPVIWVDTAGLRDRAHAVEAAGIEVARGQMASADAAVIVLDASTPGGVEQAALMAVDLHDEPACVVLNKIDLVGEVERFRRALPEHWRRRAVEVSATERTGLEDLRAAVLEHLGRVPETLLEPAAFTERQVLGLLSAAEAADRDSLRAILVQLLEG